MTTTLAVSERFWAKVRKTDTCWLWTAAKGNTAGYGAFRVNGHRVVASRMAWELTRGPIPEGLHENFAEANV